MVSAEDSANNKSTSDLQAIQVRLPDKHLSRNHFGGTAQRGYRLISFPLDFDYPQVAANLLDDLGEADSSKWRLWEIDAENSDSIFPYKEFPAVSDLTPGESKFLITRENVSLTVGAGVTVNTAEPFEISMQSGWNMIANPFNFDIPISNVEPESLRIHLNTYSSSWSSSPEFLKPFEGYMIKIKEPVSLRIHASTLTMTQNTGLAKIRASTLTMSQNTSLAKTSASADTPASSFGMNRIKKSAVADTLTSSSTMDWFIQIKAESDLARDDDNIAGVIEDAELQWDCYERYEPPPIGEFVTVSFPHLDWQDYPDIHTTDYRPPSAGGHSWNFSVDTNIPNKLVGLEFGNIESVPPEFEIQLIDLTLNMTEDLRQESLYRYSSGRVGGRRDFKIVVGDAHFVEGNVSAYVEIPSDYELSQNYPNPFNPATTISFGLPEGGRVFLTVFNILGQEVVTLMDGVERGAGFTSAFWDGRDRSGALVPSGIYIYRLRVGQRVLHRKLTLLR
jgi:hypothetical protein